MQNRETERKESHSQMDGMPEGRPKKGRQRRRIKGVFGNSWAKVTHRRPEQVVQTNEPMVILT
jgi:hypothetical protein